MSPSPLLPKGHTPWLPRNEKPFRGGKGAGSAMTEEQLADYHASRIYRLTFGQTIAGLVVLTVAAAVVILPFIYMLLISMKSSAEVGNNRLLPQEFENFRLGRTAWIRVNIPTEQVQHAVDMNSLPVQTRASAEQTSGAEPGRLPPGTLPTRRLSIDNLPGQSQAEFLLEAKDPTAAMRVGEKVNVYLPAPNQMWQVAEGEVQIRTWLGLGSRLLENYKRLLKWDAARQGRFVEWINSGYPRWYFNSLVVAFSTVIIGVFLDSLAAFGFAKFNFPFKQGLFAVLILTLMIPYPVTLVPTFFIFAKIGFYNTFLALIIPGVVSAFGIFLVRQYMETIPDDMLDAARVDGASDFQVYRKVVLPAARPVLAALAVFRFIFQWNTYLYPLVLTNKDSMKTVQLGIATMEDIYGEADYGLQMAGSAMAILPILLVYMFMQKHFIAGITMGSSKG